MIDFAPAAPPDRRRPLLIIMALAVLLAAVVPYLWVLRLPLTAVDTIPTVEAARVVSFQEIPALLLRELRGGADPNAAYYRPLTLATYAVDYAFWGWNAFGYQLTDLLLHGLAALAVFFMALVAFDRRPIWALLVAGIFLFHPATIEVVPAVARRQEPLLVFGIALALIGARLLPSPRGGLLLILGSLVAVTAVERGLMIPGIVFVYLFIYRGEGPAPARARHALLATLPALLVAVTFYLAHRLLFAQSDQRFVLRNLVDIPARFGAELLYPQQLFDFKAPRNAVAALPWALLAAGGLVGLPWSLGRSREGAICACGGLFAAGYCAFLAVAGQEHPWYTYTAAPALALALAALLERGAGQLALPGRQVRARGLVALLGATACLVAVAWPSPLFRSYGAWPVAGRLSQEFLAELRAVAGTRPAGESLVIFNLPGAYAESEADYLVTRSAAILWPRSVRAWTRVSGVPNPVLCLGASRFVGTVSRPDIAFEQDGRVRVRFAGGPSSLTDPDNRRLATVPGGFEFAWPPPEVAGRAFQAFVFDGHHILPLRSECGTATVDMSRAVRAE